MLVENELKKLERFDSNYFRGKNYFAGDHAIQNYLVFQPMSKYFKTYIGVDKRIIFRNGNLKDFLMKSLNLLPHLTIVLILN